MEGTFLQRPELNDAWDWRIYLETSSDIARSRAVKRDHHRLGDDAEVLYLTRYEGAYALYVQEVDPLAEADCIIDLTNLEAPHLRRPKSL